MPAFGVTAAQIVALFMESVFYGIYLVTFFSCMRVLLRRDGQPKPWATINKMMVIAALLMLIFATLDVAFGLRHNLEAFVYDPEKGIPPEDEFSKISEWLSVMKFVNYSAQTFIGDGILLYRCFVIYNRRWWVVILPMLMWIATAVCSAFTIQIESTIGTGELSQSQFQPFISSALALTLATNVVTTSLIIFRIYKIQSKAANHATPTPTCSPYSRLIRTLIECGAMYTLSIVILFACYLSGSNAILGVSDSVVQIIGITFNLLILNIDQGRATNASTSMFTNNILHTTNNIPPLNSPMLSGRGLPLHQLRISTVRTTVRDPPEAHHIGRQVRSSSTNGGNGRSADEESQWEHDSTDVEKASYVSSPLRNSRDEQPSFFAM